MRKTRRRLQCIFTVLVPMLLSACLLDDSADTDRGFDINFTNPGGVSLVQTPDIIVNISGTVNSAAEIETVNWQNDRGGKGTAIGTRSWETGNIVLQVGTNNITITAMDVIGGSVSKNLTVEREDTTVPGGNGPQTEPTVMYSYNSDLRNAAPIKGASVQAGTVFLFLVPSDDWVERGINNITYLCCKGQSGPGAGATYDISQKVIEKPWQLPVDLTGMDIGGTRRIKIWADLADGSNSDDPVFDFKITDSVSGNNNAPVVTGFPSGTATVGNQYNFRPTAQDADGDTMRFSINNKPSWTSFDEFTGRLFGTPGSSDVGMHESIVISVSDGTTTSSLPAFTIMVEAIANGLATVIWSAPTERTDDTPLTSLAGFNIYYGQTSGDYGNKVALNNPGITTYVVDNLSTGTWYFVVTAVDVTGLESNPSDQGTKSF